MAFVREGMHDLFEIHDAVGEFPGPCDGRASTIATDRAYGAQRRDVR
ncbi:hypothetical protein [Sphingomonas sp. R86520]